MPKVRHVHPSAPPGLPELREHRAGTGASERAGRRAFVHRHALPPSGLRAALRRSARGARRAARTTLGIEPRRRGAGRHRDRHGRRGDVQGRGRRCGAALVQAAADSRSGDSGVPTCVTERRSEAPPAKRGPPTPERKGGRDRGRRLLGDRPRRRTYFGGPRGRCVSRRPRRRGPHPGRRGRRRNVSGRL